MSKSDSFYNMETFGGILLFTAAILAMVIANSPLQATYERIFQIIVNISIGDFVIEKPLRVWVNDGLMAVYFMLVGLEIKREIKRGILSSKTSVFVPAITACFGLLVPALIYFLFNYDNSFHLRGWAIPTATDIAFTLGIISLLKNKVPFSLKILLTAIAIFDDIGAIVIIAIFFSHKLSYLSLAMAASFTMILIAFNYFGVKRISLYIVVGVCLWAAVLKSGVHATLAGIVIAMTIPDEPQKSTLTSLEHSLHPWVAFVILPAFAFANAGVTFFGIQLGEVMTHPVVLGITVGLFLGKQIGVFLPLCYFVKQKKYLDHSSYTTTLKQVYGVSLICGVGFTMSLFIGSLAFSSSAELMNLVKIGVVSGSILSGVLGSFVFLYSPRQRLPN